MAYGTAIEKLGNVAKKRNAPSRYGTEVGQVSAGGSIEFVEIVPVQPQGTADKAGETWFKLPDGSFVNYQLRNWLGVLTDYFTVLTMPSTDPEPTPEGETVVDIAFAADNRSVTVTVNTADMYGEATITLTPK